jgi:hypothetical protein
MGIFRNGLSITLSILAFVVSLGAAIISYYSLYYDHIKKYHDIRIHVSDLVANSKASSGKFYHNDMYMNVSFINNGNLPIVITTTTIGVRLNSTGHANVCPSGDNISRWFGSHKAQARPLTPTDPIILSGGESTRKRLLFHVGHRIEDFLRESVRSGEEDLDLCIYFRAKATGPRENKQKRFEGQTLIRPGSYAPASDMWTYYGPTSKWLHLKEESK